MMVHMKLNPGFHAITKEEYHANPHERPLLSATTAKRLLFESPERAWDHHPCGGALSDEPTKPMIQGICLDSLLMGNDTPLVCLPDEMPDDKGKPAPTNGEFRHKSSKEWAKQQRALGFQPVGKGTMATLLTAVEAMKFAFHRKGHAFEGAKQVTAIWEKDGVVCKARMDELTLGDQAAAIFDLKKMKSLHPDAIAVACDRMGYDIQAAAYIEAIETLRPELAGRVTFTVLGVEMVEPYHYVAVKRFSESYLMMGREKWARAKATWAKCVASGIFPGYPEGEIQPPSYAIGRFEERMSAMDSEGDDDE